MNVNSRSGFMLQRWLTVLVVFLLICGGAILSIWLLLKPVCYVTGAIRVAPDLSDIVTSDGVELSSYERYLNAQEERITSDRTIKKVEKDLVDRNPRFSKYLPLKQAILDGTIKVKPDSRTELLKVTMKSRNPEESKQIVNAFIGAYMEFEGNENEQLGEGQKPPARISMAYDADIADVKDNRLIYTIGIACSAILFSMLWIIICVVAYALACQPVNNKAVGLGEV